MGTVVKMSGADPNGLIQPALVDIDTLIREVRGQRVILDLDLARIYGVPTKRLNEQVKRNAQRFPNDFAFQLTAAEKAGVVASCDHLIRLKFSHVLPYAFTEHGAIMAANVLNSPQAVQMSVFVVRAFVKLRAVLTDSRDLARKLAAVETELKSRLDVHEVAIVDILQRIMKILDPPPPPPEPPETTTVLWDRWGKRSIQPKTNQLMPPRMRFGSRTLTAASPILPRSIQTRP